MAGYDPQPYLELKLAVTLFRKALKRAARGMKRLSAAMENCTKKSCK